MNRSILLVICDFFILTLLSFVQIDPTRPMEGLPESGEVSEVSAPAMSNMVASLTAALELERRERESLTNALAMTSAELRERRRLLEERERSLASTQERLATTETEARRLSEERARLERGQAEATASIRTLRQAFESTQQGAAALQERLADSTRVEAETKARAEQMAQELARREREARELQEKLAQLDASREAMREEKQKIELSLRERETEVRLTRGEVAQLSQQLTVAQTEKAQLAQTAANLSTNVGVLAVKSAAIQEEMERQRRLSANAIYSDFLSNRVSLASAGVTRGTLGQEVSRERAAAVVLVRLGSNVVAVTHLESTALRLWPADAPWSSFTLRLARGGSRGGSVLSVPRTRRPAGRAHSREPGAGRRPGRACIRSGGRSRRVRRCRGGGRGCEVLRGGGLSHPTRIARLRGHGTFDFPAVVRRVRSTKGGSRVHQNGTAPWHHGRQRALLGVA